MSVHLEKCSNERCGHLFEVEQFSKAFGNAVVAGMIECRILRGMEKWRSQVGLYKSESND